MKITQWLIELPVQIRVLWSITGCQYAFVCQPTPPCGLTHLHSQRQKQNHFLFIFIYINIYTSELLRIYARDAIRCQRCRACWLMRKVPMDTGKWKGMQIWKDTRIAAFHSSILNNEIFYTDRDIKELYGNINSKWVIIHVWDGAWCFHRKKIIIG